MKKKGKGCLTVIGVFILLCIIAGLANSCGSDSSTAKKKATDKKDTPKVTMIDFSGIAEADAIKSGNDAKIKVSTSDVYSSTVPNGGFVSQSIKAGKKVYQNTYVTVKYSKGPKPTVEQTNALAKAKAYSDSMHMSKKKIYDQLTSSYGEGFAAGDAQYAIDHLKADYNKNALEKAKDYQNSMQMSKSAIYNQLISSYGEGFTASEAQYAVDHLPQ